MITIEQIKKLRIATDMPVIDCRQALEEAEGDEKKALEVLKAKGAARAEKKADREVKSGLVEVYAHATGKIGVLVEVACETDFVARNDDFKKLCHELALQITSMVPKDVAELLEQDYIREPGKKVGDLLKETIGKIGENIKIVRFVRFELGETPK